MTTSARFGSSSPAVGSSIRSGQPSPARPRCAATGSTSPARPRCAATGSTSPTGRLAITDPANLSSQAVGRPSSESAAGWAVGRLLAECPHDRGALRAGERVDVELTAQMIGLVLEAAGKLAVARDSNRSLLQVHAGHDGVGGAEPAGADAGDGQATLLAGLLAARFSQHRVDDVTKLSVDVASENGEAGADLVRCEPGAPGDLHGVEQVGDQLSERVVEADDQVAGRAQHGVAKQAQRPHSHRATGSARVRYWLSAVSLPILSSTS